MIFRPDTLDVIALHQGQDINFESFLVRSFGELGDEVFVIKDRK